MKKRILLTKNALPLGSNISKWVLIIGGLLYSTIGIVMQHPTASWAGILIIVIGLLQVAYAFIMYDQRSVFAPKCIIDEDRISIRESVFERTKFINWNEIKLIEFKSFTLEFQFNDNKTQLIILRTSADTSIEIKKSLREIADKKQINIKGG